MLKKKDKEGVVFREYMRMNKEYKDGDDVTNPDYLDMSEEEPKDRLEELVLPTDGGRHELINRL